MRAVAICRGASMHDRGLIGVIKPPKVCHGRVKSEEAVQFEGRMWTVHGQCNGLAEFLVGGVADRWHGRQTIKCAAQDDSNEARIPAPCCMGEARHEVPGEQSASGAEYGAA